jgi:hypothetical protein
MVIRQQLYRYARSKLRKSNIYIMYIYLVFGLTDNRNCAEPPRPHWVVHDALTDGRGQDHIPAHRIMRPHPVA